MSTITDYLHSKAARNKIPLNGSFELSPVCNFSCKMCYVRRTPAQIKEEGKHIKEWTEWLAVAEQCREAGTLYLQLTGGEPFIYPHFRELYESLHKMGFILMVNSNGTMIDRETVDWLKKMAPSRMNITLYGASPETYFRICGHSDGYERAKRAILMLKEAGIPVVINASMIPENADDLEQIMAFGNENGLNTRVATYMFPPVRRIREEADSRLTAKQSAELYIRKIRFLLQERCLEYFSSQLEKISALKAQQINYNTGNDPTWGTDNAEQMKCRAGRSSFWISWDGEMTACGMMPFPVQKNPFEESFKKCWLELTDSVRCAAVLEKCIGCEKEPVCKPCAAMMNSETGDVNGKSDYLCELADHTIALMQQEVQTFERSRDDEK